MFTIEKFKVGDTVAIISGGYSARVEGFSKIVSVNKVFVTLENGRKFLLRGKEYGRPGTSFYSGPSIELERPSHHEQIASLKLIYAFNEATKPFISLRANDFTDAEKKQLMELLAPANAFLKQHKEKESTNG